MCNCKGDRECVAYGNPIMLRDVDVLCMIFFTSPANAIIFLCCVIMRNPMKHNNYEASHVNTANVVPLLVDGMLRLLSESDFVVFA